MLKALIVSSLGLIVFFFFACDRRPLGCFTLLFLHVGAGIISLRYEAIQARCGSVGIAVASSSISRGKSICAKIAIATCGNYPKGCTGYLSESMARSHLSGALPFLYDDPSTDAVLKPLLMHSFGGQEMGTRRAQFSARCSPLVTCNEFVMEALSRADER